MRQSALTNVLMKIFSSGFYRMHSGILIFLFGTILCYCFFINTLGSVPTWAFTFWNLMITLSLVSSPVIMGFFCLAALIYAVKSWQYVATQLANRNNEFLYHSASSFNKWQQFKSWFYVQFSILLPLIAYALFASIIGFNYGHYIIPVAILLYLFLLLILSVWIYIRLSNKLIDIDNSSLLMRLIRKWNKPFFLLYTLFVFDKLKITYLVTKAISWVLIIGVFAVFSDIKDGSTVPSLVVLMIVTAHTLLIYNEFRFNEKYLYFSRNFPFSITRQFLGSFLNYFILMLPEVLWFVSAFGIDSFKLLMQGFSTMILFRSLLYWIGLNMKRYLIWIFVLFNLVFLIIIYRVTWVIPTVFVPIAYLVFRKNYLNKNLID
ncbi:hypothetical protein [Pedobacter foliorum]|uniref:hypothetical protein n=1 Tax=Pedobacter foliorum TaxID=2739058 RepID=UPI001565A46F|nr:hypothetical protein [Pedobacter foliorum]NRF37289.1 hypothetical protein [Pedobacter foliorum]